MTYIQLVQPNLNIVGQDGACLAYVRQVFGASVQYSTAALAWQNAEYQHSGTPPAVAVPIWFSWQTDGHVAVWDNGTIYSTTAQGDKTFNSIDDLTGYIGEGIEYLGWSEDVDKLRVVEPQEDEVNWNNGDTYNFLAAVFGTVVANEAKAANYVGWYSVQNGMDFKTAFYDIIDSEQFGLAIQAAQSGTLNKETVIAYVENNLQ